MPVCGPLSSSTAHGQKFWGLRVVAAFLMTVIFMILLQLGYMADVTVCEEFRLRDAAAWCAITTMADSSEPL